MTADELAHAEAEARYLRERLQLYRARAYASTATTPGRLRELERANEQAERRLRSLRDQSKSQ